jgi:hypothetical protein
MIRIDPSVITCVGLAQNGSPNMVHLHLSRFAETELESPARISPMSLAGLPCGRSFPLPRTGRPFQAQSSDGRWIG